MTQSSPKSRMTDSSTQRSLSPHRFKRVGTISIWSVIGLIIAAFPTQWRPFRFWVWLRVAALLFLFWLCIIVAVENAQTVLVTLLCRTLIPLISSVRRTWRWNVLARSSFGMRRRRWRRGIGWISCIGVRWRSTGRICVAWCLASRFRCRMYRC